MFKINTEKDLVNFLKILSEESVKKSYQILKEQDPYTEYYSNKRQTEKDLFEQPAEETEAEDSVPDEAAEEEAASPPPEEAQEDSPEEDASEESFTGSKDRLVDFVNDIRSAPSIKDSMVSDQIDAYYDRLSQEEKDVLVFFLRELSRVMTGKASGTEARDPSDPPLNIDFVVKDGSEEPDTPGGESETPAEETPAEEPAAQPPAAAPAGEEEDTSAPIRVDEAQDHTYLRMKIREILK